MPQIKPNLPIIFLFQNCCNKLEEKHTYWFPFDKISSDILCDWIHIEGILQGLGVAQAAVTEDYPQFFCIYLFQPQEIPQMGQIERETESW